ncbi:hypothetical protein K490DRAFT_70080 [Saccharata proteae CBS 121410]|uniref:DNA polymerase delta subunit 3 n=1 Tax=Saccharata proteae CBS 121410 TaxID=1314787 RepID=A0A9P4HKD5_9PEZI|nr:hypothetical protein K490DRAFT_70080 [Saccharata proteae CBS 121410]
MDIYKEYLAVNVLNESKIVNYRLLSRALKVHCNLAKQMLFEFHATQNAKKPGSVHATYIVTGTKRKSGAITNGSNTQDGDGDSFMRSSPFQSSIPDQDQDRDPEEDLKVTSITLTREEDLDNAKSQCHEITSIHIYSLEPGPLQDLQVLSDCNRRIHSEFAAEDPLELWKTYGIIHNPNARRRTNKRPAPAPAPVATTATAKTAPKPSTTATAKPKTKEDVKPAKATESAEVSRTPTPQVDTAAMPNKKTAAKAPSLSREGSNIFKSFAKAKPKAKKEPTPPAQSAEASAAEDEPMKDASDDEGENEPAKKQERPRRRGKQNCGK